MFEKLESLAADADGMFDELAHELVSAGEFHELFDARLAEARYRLQLPLDRSANLDDLPEPQRTQLEDAYLAACREVGQLLVDAGRFREGWMYLRPAGDKQIVREALERVVPDDECVEELIQVALHEGVAAERGLGWMLGHYGTCNSITTFEQLAGTLSPTDQRGCAAVLVRHLHDELSQNVRAHIERQSGERQTGESVATATLSQLVSDNPWLFEHENYHVDTSHLSAVVRFARLLVDPAVVRLALDLTEYGRRLAKPLQFPGEPPFTDVFPSHQRLFLATLGEAVDEAVEYFTEQVKSSSIADDGTGPVETLLILLFRLGRYHDALASYGEFVPADVNLSPYAPTLLELARRSGNWDRYLEIARLRNDAVGFVLGQVARN